MTALAEGRLAPTPTADQVLADLLASLDLSVADLGGTVTIKGDDPLVSSRHRLAAATAAALAAQGVAVGAIWRMRSGRGQDVTVDAAQAVHALNSVKLLKQNDVAIGLSLLPPEPINGFYRTADGRWISLIGPRLRLRNGLLELLDCANTKDAVAAAVSRWRAFELEEAAAARGLVALVVRTSDEWRGHPQGQALDAAPLIEIEKIGDSDPEPLGPGARPLSGVRVLDVAHLLAGPGTSRTLAEQGADVLRIATPREPDVLTNVIDTGFGKRHAYLDLDVPDNSRRLTELATDSDVFVQSYAPGALARRGFSADQVAAKRPGIIYVSLNAFGHSGPWALRRGFDPETQAAIGIAAAEGSLDEPKRLPTLLLCDFLAGFLGAAGALAALIRRSREGGSYHVKLSLARTGMWVQNLGLLPDVPEGLVLPPPRTAAMDTPYGRLEHLAPVTQFSETLAYWDKPTVPAGASMPLWLPR
ncbi:CoA transferase [Pseudonocardia asaccharolytica]|uniref:CoA transferase n=1 Tax=Pseudonocardia asaccharolytica DSM 44247 = NBRC 16224 TaxID=1123024 RepID=A0A511CXG5_9PSEU|nr:CoA transferase [Pseudonocardia asaccharolytica]GEL17241.1 CoA transferase [Pseudonocardia asaccharolytica DSM 44247 = NBRC 16224]